jgi:hypothetical protein
MRDPTLTTKIVPKADRARDPFEYIDDLRQDRMSDRQVVYELSLEVQALKNAEAERLTKTGAWDYVKEQLAEGAVDWGKWAMRGILSGVGILVVSGIGWVCAMAVKGMMK